MASHKRCMKSDRRWQTRWFRTDVHHTALLFICGICMHYRRPASTTTTMQKNKIEWNWNRGRTKESKQQQRNLVWNIINNKKKKKKTTSVVTTNTQKLCNRKSRVNKMWQPFLVRRAKSTNIRLPERSSKTITSKWIYYQKMPCICVVKKGFALFPIVAFAHIINDMCGWIPISEMHYEENIRSYMEFRQHDG